ncbi:MAG: hypothetical protein KKC80_00185 [Candidatus Margulisbacteria bacterium]|nr:hypothetical protein [Candidatus Margulisiibacteriota bacterium]MBU1617736.1 hypothetical protein [Candidatus Margulisiibacteriota bacterium]MBU1866865.1 hypothetical protein [Candidatus Margulisiibacteriota bacterium]
MKKLLSLALLLALGLFAVSGCGTTTGGTVSTTIPTAAAATSIGALASTSLTVDNNILGVTAYATSVKSSQVRASSPTTPAYSGGWWTSAATWAETFEGFSYTYDWQYQFKIWNTAGTEITTPAGLDPGGDGLSASDVSKIWAYVTFDYTLTTTSGAFTTHYQFGESTAKPFKMEGFGTASRLMDGYTKYTGSYGGDSYSISFTYSALSLTSTGYPSGSVSFSFSVSAGEAYAGTITYDGTNTALLTFTSGGTGTYAINLDTGTTTVAAAY